MKNLKDILIVLASFLTLTVILSVMAQDPSNPTVIAPVPPIAELTRAGDNLIVQWDHDESSYSLTSNYVFTVASAKTGVAARSFLVSNTTDILDPSYFYKTNSVGEKSMWVTLQYQLTDVMTNMAYNIPFQLAVASQDGQGKIWPYSNWIHIMRGYDIQAPGIRVFSGGLSDVPLLSTNDIGTIILITR